MGEGRARGETRRHPEPARKRKEKQHDGEVARGLQGTHGCWERVTNEGREISSCEREKSTSSGEEARKEWETQQSTMALFYELGVSVVRAGIEADERRDAPISSTWMSDCRM